MLKNKIMKKPLVYTYLVVFLFFMHFAFAEITIDSMNVYVYNIGEKVNLKGALVFNEDLEGSMNIDLRCDNNTLPAYFTLLDLAAGEVYEYNLDVPTRESLIGVCNFLVTVHGLVEDFVKESQSFTITNELNVDVTSDKLVLNPGDLLSIHGSATKANGELIDDASATLIIDDVSDLVELEKGSVKYSTPLSSSIKSGRHEIKLIVEDKDKNRGEETTSFRINAIPTNIELTLGSGSYSPDESLNGKADLYDQAGDLMDGSGVVEIYSTNSSLEFSRNIMSQDSFEFKLDQFSIPGRWRVNVLFGNVEVNKDVYVNEVKHIDTWLDGNVVFVRNTGNVDYSDPLELALEGSNGEVNVVKETVLKPNQTIQFDLSKEVEYGGEYVVKSPTGITGNVVLEGRKKIGGTIAGWFALMFVFLFFIYLVLKRGRRSVSSSKRDVKSIRKKGKRILEKRLEKRKAEILERTETKEDKIRQEDINYLVKKATVKERDMWREDSKKSSDDQNMFRIFD